MQPEANRDPDKEPQKPKRTPNTDMQAEDAGTPESGVPADAGRGTAAEGAMKQTSKTDTETGSRG